jgi:cysteine desulfurase/selenocysteine lyase
MAQGMTPVSSPTPPDPAHHALDAGAIRAHFPILQRRIHGHPLVYLDSAATSPVPTPVINAMTAYWQNTHAGVRRSVHTLSAEATGAYESARAATAAFLGARDPAEIVFLRGVTEAINLLAQGWSRPRLRPGDEIVATIVEHHANLVPWQVVCAQTGATLRLARMTDRNEIDLDHLATLLSPRTRAVAITHISNVTGAVTDIAAVARLAHRSGALCFVDGAQAAAHIPIDLSALQCDAYAISGHKMHAPTGIGALWCRAEILKATDPWQTGGEMIAEVTPHSATWADPPARFEAGTPNSAGAIGLHAAIDFLASLGFPAIRAHEDAILRRITDGLAAIPGVRTIAAPARRAAVVSFTIDNVHPHDAATILDTMGIAVRSGHACAQPLMAALSVDAVLRASVAPFTTEADVDALLEGVRACREMFA